MTARVRLLDAQDSADGLTKHNRTGKLWLRRNAQEILTSVSVHARDRISGLQSLLK
jgi:hypothetical protein